MKMPKTAPWVLGTAFAAVVILVLAWMVGISPQLDRARQADADAEGVRIQNTTLAARLETLRDQFEHLDEYKAELAAIQRQIPAADEEPALTREIEAATTSAGIFLVSITTEDPLVFMAAPSDESTAVPPAEAETTAAEGTAAGETGGTGDAAAATPEGTTAAVAPVAPSVPGFVTIPVSVTVLGSYDAAVRFVELAQNSFSRLFVVTSLVATGQKPSPPSGGKPEIREGDVEAVISGYVYVLHEQDASLADETASAAVDS